MVNSPTELANAIRKIRLGHGMSQKTFADALGVHSISVSEWERGKALPGAIALKRISDTFGVSIDALMKHYEDPKQESHKTSITPNEYQKLAMRTNDGKSTERLLTKCAEIDNLGDIINGCLGLPGELGELNDMVKKWIFHEAPFDYEHAKKEIGDVLWYVALICHAFGWDIETIMQMNIDKLKARYPEGFDAERSLHRQKGDI
jgi:transcriptional regulator with XRE-family HTH domain